jgi:catechol 2,3-dioxygenase-like lactoylglutathione lyase family enzyme
LPREQTHADNIVVARDPAGNTVELVERAQKPAEIGGPKLIVDDREKAENFYRIVFDAKPDERFVSPVFDQVYMSFGAGAFLSVFQPKSAAPAAKPEIPAMSVQTRQLDQVILKIKSLGLTYRETDAGHGSRSVVAFDTAGNSIEIVEPH